MGAINTIFYIAILIMSVVIHEVMHGFAAEYFGDRTARYAGRLTLNPLAHLDLFGSILLPAFLVLTHSSFLVGWAKPVPYNPNNLSNKKWGTVAVASAGVLANLFIAAFFGALIRLSFIFSLALPESFYTIAAVIVGVNLALAIFNLIPIPPLDGSKILFSFLPESLGQVTAFLERYAFILLIIFIIYFAGYLAPVMAFLFKLVTGLAI